MKKRWWKQDALYCRSVIRDRTNENDILRSEIADMESRLGDAATALCSFAEEGVKLYDEHEAVVAENDRLRAEVEETGQALAEWAAGASAPTFALADLYAALEVCATRDELDTLTEHARKHRASMSTAEKTAIKAALDMAAARVATTATTQTTATDDDSREGME